MTTGAPRPPDPPDLPGLPGLPETPAPPKLPRATGLHHGVPVHTVDDWSRRALELLTEEGVGAVTVARLCRDLGVSKGSFYWRFDDLQALHTAVARRWAAQTREGLGEMSRLAERPPLERIRAMTLGLLRPRAWLVQRAVRDWARTDVTVAAAVEESDAFVHGLVETAMLDLGLPPARARVLAGLLVHAGIGFAQGPAGLPVPGTEEIDGLIDLLAQEQDRAGQA